MASHLKIKFHQIINEYHLQGIHRQHLKARPEIG